jgi:hypothetical protein
MLRTIFQVFVWLVVCATAWSMAAPACVADIFKPREIDVARRNVADELVDATRGNQIERGTKRPVVDGLGWVFGIPSKIILWDRRVDNHTVSPRTEEAIRRYLADNELEHVKVRINQYAPLDDWRRLRKNKTVGWGYRYTIGALSVAGEAIFPGRLFGGDRYNPYSATVHLYSDVPAIALHEGGHAKDFTRRDWPGTYGFVTALPFVNLWGEAIASGDAIAYAEKQADPQLAQESYRILFPAYGTYIGGSVQNLVAAPVAMPIFASTVVAGHVFGRIKASEVDTTPVAPLWEAKSSDRDGQLIPAVALEPLPAVE